jgi:hypothetical protein
MFELCILLITFCGIILGKCKYNNFVNPLASFNIVWFIVSLMMIKGNPTINEPTIMAKSCVLIGVFAFNIANLMPFYKISLIYKKYKFGNALQHDYVLNLKLLHILSIFVIVYSIYNAIDAIQYTINGGALADVRNEFYSYDNTNTPFKYYFDTYVFSPIRYIVIVGTIVGYFFVKEERLLLLNCFLIILLQGMQSAGRYVFFNTILMIFCCFALTKKASSLKVKSKKIIFIFVPILITVILGITANRTTIATDNITFVGQLWETIYSYFVGSITYMGVVNESYPFIKSSTFGINFIAGFLSPFFAGLTFFNLISYPDFLKVVGTYACEQLPIGDIYFNAMPTIFMYYYIDFGYIGVFIETYIFGRICYLAYRNICINENLLYVSFYILIFVQICVSSTRWFFYSSDFALAFIYIWLIFKRKRVN